MYQGKHITLLPLRQWHITTSIISNLLARIQNSFCYWHRHLTHAFLLATLLQAGKLLERMRHDKIYGNHYSGAWAGSMGRSHTTGTRIIGTGSIRQYNSLLSYAHTSHRGTSQAGDT